MHSYDQLHDNAKGNGSNDKGNDKGNVCNAMEPESIVWGAPP